MTTGKAIALTRQTFVGKVMSLFFNFVTEVSIHSDFGTQENKLCYYFPICHEVMGPDAMILVF